MGLVDLISGTELLPYLALPYGDYSAYDNTNVHYIGPFLGGEVQLNAFVKAYKVKASIVCMTEGGVLSQQSIHGAVIWSPYWWVQNGAFVKYAAMYP